MKKHLYFSNSGQKPSRGMKFDRFTLAFPAEIEKDFKIKYFHDSLIQFRVSFLLVTILYGVFGYLDWKVIAEHAQLFNFIRFGIVIPLLSLVLLFSFSKYFIRVWQLLLFVCFVVAGAGITVMTLKAPENYAYYAGMMLIFSAGYFFIKLRFFLATLAGWITLLLFNIGAFTFSGIDANLIISNNFFFAAANFIGMFAAYNIEFYTRKDFFLNQQLDSRNNEIAEANKNLESKVEERTKELLLEKLRAEESDKLKTAFLTNMSHEIRTPMNGILGFAELLKIPDLAGELQLEYIDVIKKSSDRMLNIINDIVDISSIEAGLVNVSLTETDINAQSGYVYDFFKPEANEKGIMLSVHKGLQGNAAIVLTDEEKLYAILTNLVKNAIKFSDSGSIEFGYKLKPLTNSPSQEGVQSFEHAANKKELVFYVKDTGIGIPVDRQQAIFDRFVQADIADSRAFQGAGLGLSISKAFVEMLDGKIWVESEEGKGSSFYFTLPYTPVSCEEIAVPKAVQIKEVEKEVRKLAILVVEDDDTSALLIGLILKDFGREILKATSGKAAVDICRNNPNLDLILMDVKMPDLNGYEATRQIRKFNKDVVIIAQTAYAMIREKEQALEAGCNDYISKPIGVEILKGMIKKYFGK
ncbi:MAG: ATP-binding protein [Bacteroidota bacterium]